jgi:DNA polymerase V
MKAFDAINERYGRGAIHLGVRNGKTGKDDWKMKRDYLSPEYTTDINQIPIVK